MKLRGKIVSLLWGLLVSSLLMSCSSTKNVTSNDIERKVVIGKAINFDSTVASEALVSLFDVRIINDHDSIFKTYSTSSGNNGIFVLQGVPDGEYLLYIYDVSKGMCDLSRIKKTQTSLQLPGSVVLKPLVVLKGRVIATHTSTPMKVIIPGFGASSKIDNYGYYILSDVPAGDYELAFINKSSVSYLQVKIPAEPVDTVFIKDYYFNKDQGALLSANSY